MIAALPIIFKLESKQADGSHKIEMNQMLSFEKVFGSTVTEMSREPMR